MDAPPFLVNFSDVESYYDALPPDVLHIYRPELEDLIKKSLPPAVSIRCLATLFGYSGRFIGALYHNTEHYYRTFKIPKSRSYRTINAPRVALKVIQKWFGYHLGEVLEFEKCVFGFVKGKSAPQAACLHCGAEWVFSVDIENFFQSTPIDRIKKSLIALGYSEYGARLISKLCCFRGYLSQGSPASPILSNIVFSPVDKEILNITKSYDVQYTRYADDIVISGKEEFSPELADKIKEIVKGYGWKLSDKKEYRSKKPNRLKVYGLIVNNEKPRLTKGYRNKIRAYEHLLKKGKIAEEDILRVKGHLAYARSVDNLIC